MIFEGKKGDIVYCEHGHPQCELVHDLRAGQMNWAAAFGNWKREHPPKVGDLQPIACEVCGSLFDAWKARQPG